LSDLTFRAAAPSDVAALHPLIERAYRGETAKAGWTHEADMLEGARTSAAELTDLIEDPARVILLSHRDGVLVGCVQIARAGDRLAYLGMLTVEPTLQAWGLGRRLLAAAETEAVRRFGARRMEMTVIHRRSELIAWYERRGYVATGERRPFPVASRADELHFVVLEKAI